MRHDPAAHASQFHERARVRNAAVTPANFLRIFIVRVLGFVDEHVGIGKEVDHFTIRHHERMIARQDLRITDVSLNEFVVRHPKYL